MTMNCEEYRLAIAADPSSEDGDAHVAACPGCRAINGGNCRNRAIEYRAQHRHVFIAKRALQIENGLRPRADHGDGSLGQLLQVG